MTVEAYRPGTRRVRPIAPGDEDGLLKLWRETWTSTYGPSLDAAASAALLRSLDQGTASMLSGQGERGYAFIQRSQIIGSAITAERGEIAHLWGMYVLPAHQRSGAGSQLLAAVTHDLGTSAVLEARVLTSSWGAQAFYRARGFREVGEEMTEVMPGVDLSTSVLRADIARLRATIGG